MMKYLASLLYTINKRNKVIEVLYESNTKTAIEGHLSSENAHSAGR